MVLDDATSSMHSSPFPRSSPDCPDRKFGRGDTGRLYQTFPVCALCYELYQRELKLRKMEKAFGQVIRGASKGASTHTLAPSKETAAALRLASQSACGARRGI